MNHKELEKLIRENGIADNRFSSPNNAKLISESDAYFESKLNSIVLKKFYNKTMSLPVPKRTLGSSLVQYYDKNETGNDYVVGDLHCQFDQLDKQLFEINFDKAKDRLFAVGDLIDRANIKEDGYRVLEFLNQSWFFSTLGNHEELILTLLSLPKSWFETVYRSAMQNGAQWLTKNDEKLAKVLYQKFNDERRNRQNDLTFKQLMNEFPLIKKIYFEFSKLPYLIKIGNNAIIHAEVPLFITDFDDLIAKIEAKHIETLISLLWGRERIENDINQEVTGIDKIYCGHSIVQEADNYANHRMIDIGAYQSKSGRLHIEKINH